MTNTRDEALDLLRGTAVFLFLIVHVLWTLTGFPPAWNYENLQILGTAAPVVFFFVAGWSAYYSHRNLKVFPLVLRSLVLIGVDINLGLSSRSEWVNGPLFMIGIYQLLLLAIFWITQNYRQWRAIILAALVVVVFILTPWYQGNFPIKIRNEFMPWLIAPLLGYLFALLFAERLGVVTATMISRTRRLVLLLGGIVAGVILYLTKNSFQMHMLECIAWTIVLYAAFGLFPNFWKKIDILKIFSRYALPIWYFHWIVLEFLTRSGLRLPGPMAYTAFLTVTLFFIYGVFKHYDEWLRSWSETGRLSFVGENDLILLTIMLVAHLMVQYFLFDLSHYTKYYFLAYGLQLIVVESLRRYKFGRLPAE